MKKFALIKLVEELMRQNAMRVDPYGLYWETSNKVGETTFKNFVHVQIGEKRCAIVSEFYYVTKDDVIHLVNHDKYSYPEEVFEEITDEEFRADCLSYHRSHGGVQKP